MLNYLKRKKILVKRGVVIKKALPEESFFIKACRFNYKRDTAC